MSDSEPVRRSFRGQAEFCRRLGSPFTALVCELLAERLDDRTRFGRRILSWNGDPVADALPLRAAGGLHALARSGQSPPLSAVYPPHGPDREAVWDGIAAAMRDHAAFLHDYLDSPPQTNEVKRCGAILGACLLVAAETRLPLTFLEIGSSCGLNLAFNRYRYELGDARTWGDPESGVAIRCEWRGEAPPLGASLSLTDRAGCDPSALDPSSPRDRERLFPYIWPDQAERLATTKAALDAAAAAPWRVERADAGPWIEERLGEDATGRTRVLAHTIVWQYLPQGTKGQVERAVRSAAERATAQSPLAWFSMEADGDAQGAALNLSLWPGGEDRFLGRADFHGRWIDWG
jgi:hypothetical protein